MGEYSPLNDDRVIELARLPVTASAPHEDIRELAGEVIRHRRNARRDSRRAEQVKKLRWMSETILRKLEELVESDSAQPQEPPWLSDLALALGEITPSGAPLALNWTQAIAAVAQLRAHRDELGEALSEACSLATTHRPEDRQRILELGRLAP